MAESEQAQQACVFTALRHKHEQRQEAVVPASHPGRRRVGVNATLDHRHELFVGEQRVGQLE